jgi:hypothetical protein
MRDRLPTFPRGGKMGDVGYAHRATAARRRSPTRPGSRNVYPFTSRSATPLPASTNLPHLPCHNSSGMRLSDNIATSIIRATASAAIPNPGDAGGSSKGRVAAASCVALALEATSRISSLTYMLQRQHSKGQSHDNGGSNAPGRLGVGRFVVAMTHWWREHRISISARIYPSSDQVPVGE